MTTPRNFNSVTLFKILLLNFNPNKAPLFEGYFFLGGGQSDQPPFLFQEELI